MRKLWTSELDLIHGGLQPHANSGGMSPNLLPPPGGPSGYNEFGGDGDFTDYSYVPWSNYSDGSGSSAYGDSFIDYMSSYLSQDTDLTALGTAVGAAVNLSIEQLGAAAIGSASVDASVSAAAAGVGAAYGGGVTIAAAAGWEVGSWIYNKYEVQIDNATETVIDFIRRHLP